MLLQKLNDGAKSGVASEPKANKISNGGALRGHLEYRIYEVRD